ncbi:MAG TPA: FGGY-family carbohydrate kinase [Spirochaetota bacterium]|nr:FGGY-family carbohydrate kinase [Spirochaetota bacterium]HPC40384.1 FGGY-family carbohydrate kinase [Spirochaetota bacterium]HPL17334.1 FGGY-family carbohydrate kinase [Spirochaetota bacterium]HQF07683.1 FGGY-family carbohydrate kinase [Spirochaetota bacterium]HQH96415.1 FGGY-family carbohydrate kinase [Spirochaetota bacterium]
MKESIAVDAPSPRPSPSSADELYVLAIDLGSGGPKAAVVSDSGLVRASASEKVALHLLPHGGAEQDPIEWWACVKRAVKKAIRESGVSPERIAAVSCDSQYFVIVPIDENGEPLMRALHWLDARGAPYNTGLIRGLINIEGYGASKLFRWINLNGLAPSKSGIDSVGHVLYLKHERPDIYRKTWKFLEPMDYITLRLTGRCAATQETMIPFMAVDNRTWGVTDYHPGLIRLAGLDREKLPDLLRNKDIVGTVLPEVAAELGLSPSTQVIAGSNDTNASAVGSGAVRDFEGLIYIGTSLVLTCHLPFKKTDIFHAITTMPSPLPDRYLLFAEQLTGGKALEFYLTTMVYGDDGYDTGPVPDDAFSRAISMAGESPAGSDGVIFMPWLNGTMTPEENGWARGGFFNLSLSTNRGNMTRAVMESLAYNNRWTREVAERFTGERFRSFRFAGGGAQSDLWAQIHADVLGVPIHQVDDPTRTTLRGTAMLAVSGLGMRQVDELPGLIRIKKIFEPDPKNRAVYDHMYGQYRQLFIRNKKIFANLNSTR